MDGPGAEGEPDGGDGEPGEAGGGAGGVDGDCGEGEEAGEEPGGAEVEGVADCDAGDDKEGRVEERDESDAVADGGARGHTRGRAMGVESWKKGSRNSILGLWGGGMKVDGPSGAKARLIPDDLNVRAKARTLPS